MRRRQQKFKSRLRLLTDRSDMKHRKKKPLTELNAQSMQLTILRLGAMTSYAYAAVELVQRTGRGGMGRKGKRERWGKRTVAI